MENILPKEEFEEASTYISGACDGNKQERRNKHFYI
jgi:hypothetical protein